MINNQAGAIVPEPLTSPVHHTPHQEENNTIMAPNTPAGSKKQSTRVTWSVHSTVSSIGNDDFVENRRRDDGLDSSVRSSRSTGSRRRSTFKLRRKPANAQDRLALVDDEEGHAECFLTLLYESLEDSKLFVAGSIGVLILWSVGCAIFSEWLRQKAHDDPGGRAERWQEDIEACRSAISILGTLFVFTLVFRFNTCYDRW